MASKVINNLFSSVFYSIQQLTNTNCYDSSPSYFRYLSIEIDQNRLMSFKVDNHKKSCDRFLSTSDICRLISIEFDRQRSIFIDYRNYRFPTSCGLTTYTFFSTGQTRPIKSNLTCETKNLTYVIQCNRCNLQYIGETKRRLKDRRTIDNPNNKNLPQPQNISCPLLTTLLTTCY